MKRIKMKEVDKVKKHIKKVYPDVKDIDVEVKELPKDGFKSIIKVSSPQKKMIALKIDKDIKKSIERSQHAIIKQIHKARAKWKRKRLTKYERLGLLS